MTKLLTPTPLAAPSLAPIMLTDGGGASKYIARCPNCQPRRTTISRSRAICYLINHDLFLIDPSLATLPSPLARRMDREPAELGEQLSLESHDHIRRDGLP